MAKAPRKPLIFADSPIVDTRVAGAEHHTDAYDASYIPGYSDVVAANELRAARGLPQIPIKARAQWVRVSRANGETVREVDEGMIEWLRMGYRAVGLDDLKEFGWGMPPAATVGPDGLIRRADLALFAVGADRAEDLKRKAEEESSIRPQVGDRIGSEVYVDEATDTRVSISSLLKELPHEGD